MTTNRNENASREDGYKGDVRGPAETIDLLCAVGGWRNQIATGIARFVNEVFGGIEQFYTAANKAVQILYAFADAFPEAIKRLTANLYEGLLEYSWFIDPKMTVKMVRAISKLVEKGDEVAINQIFTEYFKANMDNIEKRIVDNHPDRGRIITEAFAAHRERRYGLSVPVFILQADGISRELLGTEYFSGYEKCKTKAEKLAHEVTDDLFLTSALRALIPLGASRKHTSRMKRNDFNRHAIMHGFDQNYDNELNSIKAISLLNFMSSLYKLKRSPKRTLGA